VPRVLKILGVSHAEDSEDPEHVHFTYFQFLGFPSAIHSISRSAGRTALTSRRRPRCVDHESPCMLLDVWDGDVLRLHDFTA
jgi:hypothetical protein